MKRITVTTALSVFLATGLFAGSAIADETLEARDGVERSEAEVEDQELDGEEFPKHSLAGVIEPLI
jgi:hypothetical protein